MAPQWIAGTVVLSACLPGQLARAADDCQSHSAGLVGAFGDFPWRAQPVVRTRFTQATGLHSRSWLCWGCRI